MSADRRHLIIGTVVFVGLGLLTLLVFSGIPRGMYDRRGDTVTLHFPTTSALSKKALVRVRGVPVGKVKNIELENGGRSAKVQVAVRKEGMPLYRNAYAELDFATVLGGNYVIDLHAGDPAKGKLASPMDIPASRNKVQVEVDQAVQDLRGGERQGMKTLFHELPKAFEDQRAPSRSLGKLADVSPRLTRALDGLRGETPDRDLRNLVKYTGETTRALDTPIFSSATPSQRHALTVLVEGGSKTFDTTGNREADIRSTIDQASRVLPETRRTVAQLDNTLTLADPVVNRLRPAADDVAPTLRVLRPTLVNADALLKDARPLLRSLRPAVTSLAGAARRGRPVVDQVTPIVNQLNDHVLPDLAKRDKVTGRATYEMLGSGVASLHSLAGAFDNQSGLVNLSLGAGERVLDPAFCKTYLTNPSEGDIVKCQNLGEALNTLFSYNPVPQKAP